MGLFSVNAYSQRYAGVNNREFIRTSVDMDPPAAVIAEQRV
jgi:hypothetical protein